ncbi:MAG: phosphate transporter, phosphate-binding protein PstS, partial [Pseudomonadota bacterium]
RWALKEGDKSATALDYVPMPEAVIGTIEKAWTKVTDASGKPVALK